jgi:hypothetical protein
MVFSQWSAYESERFKPASRKSYFWSNVTHEFSVWLSKLYQTLASCVNMSSFDSETFGNESGWKPVCSCIQAQPVHTNVRQIKIFSDFIMLRIRNMSEADFKI